MRQVAIKRTIERVPGGMMMFLTEIGIAAVVGILLGRIWGEGPVQGGFIADRLTGENGTAGLAAAFTAGNAAGVPAR